MGALEAELARWAADPELSSYAERRVQRRATEAALPSPEWRCLHKKAAEPEQRERLGAVQEDVADELRLEPGPAAVPAAEPAAASADAEEETPQPDPSPEPEKQMTKGQVRERVCAELEKNADRRDASEHAWIDARFDRFEADRSGTVDEREWENLLRSMEPVLVAMTVQPPWSVEMETSHNSALAVTAVKEGSAAHEAGLSPGMVLTAVHAIPT